MLTDSRELTLKALVGLIHATPETFLTHEAAV
jgi:hypothetical protein